MFLQYTIYIKFSDHTAISFVKFMHMLRKYGQEKDTKFMKVITSKEGTKEGNGTGEKVLR